MSELNIQIAMTTELAAITPEIDTQYENDQFKPSKNTPWQRVTFLRADQRFAALGTSGPVYRSGVMQVDLFYPQDEGTGIILTRAALIEARFKPPKVLSANGQDVKMIRPVVIRPAVPDGRWFRIPVRTFYQAYTS